MQPTPATRSAPADDPTRAPAGPAFSAIAFFDAEHGVLAGAEPNGTDSGAKPASGLFWRTSDGGATWTRVPFEGTPILTFATVDASHLWAATGCADGSCTGGAIIASANGGKTWSKVSSRSVESLSFVDASHGWAVTESAPPDGGDLLETSDGGRTWAVLRRPCPFGLAIATSFVSDQRGWLGCGLLAGAGQEPKAVLETSNAGRTWAIRSEDGTDPTVGSISSSDYIAGLSMRPSGVGLMWMGRGSTTRTMNGGRTSEEIPPGDFDVSLPASASLVDDRTWFLLLFDGNAREQVLDVTHDAGSTWQELGPLPDAAN